MSMPTSWRITDWITASMSIRSANAPATATMAPYCPSNQLAVRLGLVVPSTRSPTLPVTHTAAFVTHTVTPRMTNSPASEATVPTAPVTASQTFPATGSWQGSGTGIGPTSARAGAVNGPATTTVQRNSVSDELSQRSNAPRSRLSTLELLEARNGGEKVARRLSSL